MGRGLRKVVLTLHQTTSCFQMALELCTHFWSNPLSGVRVQQGPEGKEEGRAQKLGSGSNCSLA